MKIGKCSKSHNVYKQSSLEYRIPQWQIHCRSMKLCQRFPILIHQWYPIILNLSNFANRLDRLFCIVSFEYTFSVYCRTILYLLNSENLCSASMYATRSQFLSLLFFFQLYSVTRARIIIHHFYFISRSIMVVTLHVRGYVRGEWCTCTLKSILFRFFHS